MSGRPWFCQSRRPAAWLAACVASLAALAPACGDGNGTEASTTTHATGGVGGATADGGANAGGASAGGATSSATGGALGTGGDLGTGGKIPANTGGAGGGTGGGGSGGCTGNGGSTAYSCDDGLHLCACAYCCHDYPLSWYPSTSDDWDIIPIVDALDAGLPSDIAYEFAVASRDELDAGLSDNYLQDVYTSYTDPAVTLAVEYTQQLAELPYADFIWALPTQDWGVNLANYKGGQVMAYDHDSSCRATRQLERMVLDQVALGDNDMTKVEVIVYESDRSTVYWRVMYSDNDSTVTDVGSVEFSAYDSFSTLITFHSAHALNGPLSIPIPLSVLAPALSSTFLGFTQNYVDMIASGQCG